MERSDKHVSISAFSNHPSVYFYSDRLYDSCGHKIGRKRLLLSEFSSHCNHYPRNLDKNLKISHSITNSRASNNFRCAKNYTSCKVGKSSEIKGPCLLLFQNIDWKKVFYLNEIHGIFPKDACFKRPSPVVTSVPPSSLASSLFEYNRDFDLSQNPHSGGDDDFEYLYPTKSNTNTNMYHNKTEEDFVGGKPIPQIATSKVGRPRGSGHRRGGYAKRRGTRGYRRGRGHASYSLSHRFQSQELSVASEDEESESDEYADNEDPDGSHIGLFSKDSKYFSNASSSPSLSVEDASAEDDEMAKSHEGDNLDNPNLSYSKVKIQPPVFELLPKKRGRKPKVLKSAIEDESPESTPVPSDQDDDSVLLSTQKSMLRVRRVERPMYNTSRRARGSSRGRGGRRFPDSPQNLIRFGSSAAEDYLPGP